MTKYENLPADKKIYMDKDRSKDNPKYIYRIKDQAKYDAFFNSKRAKTKEVYDYLVTNDIDVSQVAKHFNKEYTSVLHFSGMLHRLGAIDKISISYKPPQGKIDQKRLSNIRGSIHRDLLSLSEEQLVDIRKLLDQYLSDPKQWETFAIYGKQRKGMSNQSLVDLGHTLEKMDPTTGNNLTQKERE